MGDKQKIIRTTPQKAMVWDIYDSLTKVYIKISQIKYGCHIFVCG